MTPLKKIPPAEKTALHPRNLHRQRYDFEILVAKTPDLSPFVALNAFGDLSIDFFDPAAVKMLNKALLAFYYGVPHWDIPLGYLCPPIPGRADYLHHIADLVQETLTLQNHKDKSIVCFDVGVGANCVYPIIGVASYNWSFIGSDIDAVALAAAQRNIDLHPHLKGKVELRFQNKATQIFKGVLKTNEQIDICVCNPPFHASLAEATAGTLRKLSHLKAAPTATPVLNFGGQNKELWCVGGAPQFLNNMMTESEFYADTCTWFSSLVSKSEYLKTAQKTLKKLGASSIRIIPMAQGNKVSRILAWSFKI